MSNEQHPENDPSLRMTSALHPALAETESIINQAAIREIRKYKVAEFIRKLVVYTGYGPNTQIGTVIGTPPYPAEELLTRNTLNDN